MRTQTVVLDDRRYGMVVMNRRELKNFKDDVPSSVWEAITTTLPTGELPSVAGMGNVHYIGFYGRTFIYTDSTDDEQIAADLEVLKRYADA